MHTINTRYGSLNHSVWLQVRFEQRTEIFELRSGDERAIIVGADPRAHLHIDRPGVAPIEFHFEWDDSGVYVTPGYREELRVNAMPVRSRSRLSGAALIEFHGMSLDAHLSYDQPAHAPATFDEVTTSQHVRAYQLDQSLEASTVRLSLSAQGDTTSNLETHTLELKTTTFEREPITTQFVRHSDAPPLETTLIIERPAAAAPVAPIAEVRVPTPEPIRPLAPAPIVAVTRARELEAPRFEPAPATPRFHPAPEPQRSLSPSLNEAATLESSREPPTVAAPLPMPLPAAAPARIARPRPRPNLLARFGLAVKARPVVITTTALTFSLLFGMGTARVVKALEPAVAQRSASPRATTPKALAAAPAPSASAVSAPTGSVRSSAIEHTAGDAEITQAVSQLVAGRYAEAAAAYERLSSRVNGEGFRTLAALLGRASKPECKPSANRSPSCPEVLR